MLLLKKGEVQLRSLWRRMTRPRADAAGEGVDQVASFISSPYFQYECKQQLKWIKYA